MEGSAIVQLEAVIKKKNRNASKKETKTKSTCTDTLDGPVGRLGRDQPVHHNGRPLPSVTKDRGLTVPSPLQNSLACEWNGLLRSKLYDCTFGWLTEGRHGSRAHGFNSTAHTHFISTCASSAHTLVNSARAHAIMGSQVRTQALF